MVREGTPEYEQMADLWESALDDLSDALRKLRIIYPDHMYLLPESGHSAIKEAMDSTQSALAKMHKAGRFVLSQEEYDQWLADRLAKTVGKQLEREEI
jgi:flavin-dependent dehydrogenase